MPSKKPILFDDHISTDETEVQYILDTRVGKKTCMAMCEFCFLNRPGMENYSEPPEVAAANIQALREQGYKVVPLVTDTFAEDGKYLDSVLFDGDNGWYMGSAAWSSGRPLLKDNHPDLLKKCVSNGIDTIVMTSHGTEQHERKFRGLTQPRIVEQAIRNIRQFETANQAKFRIVLTFTISQDNKHFDKLKGYFDYAAKLEVDVIRFNQFADVQRRYPKQRLQRQDIEAIYQNLHQIYQQHPSDVQLSLSEDFGKWGIEVMDFPQGVGQCVAGERLFAIVNKQVFACPVDLTIKVGELNQSNQIEWDEAALKRVAQLKQHPSYGGCLGVAHANSIEVQKWLQPYTRLPLGDRIEIKEG
ncbi:hypothetical protein [Vibrio sp. WXL210]|uniref:hypothetical protein n=1 Tax=Vibrio sp. WXL210 TaxID=3450709 RepID=UPI003EC52C34